MLSNAEHPVAWAMLMYELTDAHEHLGTLIDRMRADGGIEEDFYAVLLGHVFAHLNRAWHGRNDPQLGDWSDEKFAEHSRYPSDLPPTG